MHFSIYCLHYIFVIDSCELQLPPPLTHTHALLGIAFHHDDLLTYHHGFPWPGVGFGQGRLSLVYNLPSLIFTHTGTGSPTVGMLPGIPQTSVTGQWGTDSPHPYP